MSGSADVDRAPTRLLVVDDHRVFAQAVATALEIEPDFEVVGIAADREGAEALLRTEPADVALVDLRLAGDDGIEVAATLRRLCPGIAVVLLTAVRDPAIVAEALNAGCSGVVTKDRSLAEVAAAIRAARAGSFTVSGVQAHQPEASTFGVDLTQREREVLDLLAEGRSNKAIARELAVSLHTVRNHVQSLLYKFGAHSKLQVLAIAVREGLVDPGSTPPDRRS